MTNLPAKHVEGSGDLIQQANRFVLAVLFPRSKSAIYPLALNLARSASLYQEMELEGRVFHVAFFAADIDSMKRALSLLNFASRITHTQIYGRGQLISNPFRAAAVIECYMNSLKPGDYRAHCHVSKRYRVDAGNNRLTGPSSKIPEITYVSIDVRIDDELLIDDGPYDTSSFMIPCGYITKFADFKLSPNFPGSIADQITAAGAKCNCDWCPNFKPGDVKKL